MQTINTNTTQNGQFAMNGSIQYITPHVNQSPNNDVSAPIETPDAVYHPIVIPKREWLEKDKFDQANIQRRAWLKAVAEECKLRLNEPAVLEALIFNTDPVHGIGDPSIGTLQEAVKKNRHTYLSYNTVRDNLDRLVSKKAIQKEQRPNDTSLYRLIGYEYKYDEQHVLESGSPDSGNDLNSYPNLIDHNNNQPLMGGIVYKTNLEEFYQEYAKSLDSKPTKPTKPTKPKKLEPKEVQGLIEDRLREVHREVADQVKAEFETAMTKRNILYPLAYLEKMIERVSYDKFNPHLVEDKELREQRSRAQAEINRTKAYLDRKDGVIPRSDVHIEVKARLAKIQEEFLNAKKFN